MLYFPLIFMVANQPIIENTMHKIVTGQHYCGSGQFFGRIRTQQTGSDQTLIGLNDKKKCTIENLQKYLVGSVRFVKLDPKSCSVVSEQKLLSYKDTMWRDCQNKFLLQYKSNRITYFRLAQCYGCVKCVAFTIFHGEEKLFQQLRYLNLIF